MCARAGSRGCDWIPTGERQKGREQFVGRETEVSRPLDPPEVREVLRPGTRVYTSDRKDGRHSYLPGPESEREGLCQHPSPDDPRNRGTRRSGRPPASVRPRSLGWSNPRRRLERPRTPKRPRNPDTRDVGDSGPHPRPGVSPRNPTLSPLLTPVGHRGPSHRLRVGIRVTVPRTRRRIRVLQNRPPEVWTLGASRTSAFSPIVPSSSSTGDTLSPTAADPRVAHLEDPRNSSTRHPTSPRGTPVLPSTPSVRQGSGRPREHPRAPASRPCSVHDPRRLGRGRVGGDDHQRGPIPGRERPGVREGGLSPERTPDPPVTPESGPPSPSGRHCRKDLSDSEGEDGRESPEGLGPLWSVPTPWGEGPVTASSTLPPTLLQSPRPAPNTPGGHGDDPRALGSLCRTPRWRP